VSSNEPTAEIVATPQELGQVIELTLIDAYAKPLGEPQPKDPTDVSSEDLHHMVVDEGDELEQLDFDLDDEE
jgi:hypothetical protein